MLFLQRWENGSISAGQSSAIEGHSHLNWPRSLLRIELFLPKDKLKAYPALYLQLWTYLEIGVLQI